MRGVAVGLMLAVLTAACTTQSAINRRPTSGSTTAAVREGLQSVTITVDDTFRFHPATITVHPGRVRIVLEHVGTGAPHDLQVVNFPGDFVPVVGPGQRAQTTFVAPAPGRYRFECTIHVQQGQVGTFVVLAA